MKLLVIIVSIFCTVNCSANSNDKEAISNQITPENLKKFVLEYHNSVASSSKSDLEKYCPGALDHLDGALEQAKRCFTQQNESLTVCETFQTFLGCSGPLENILDNCTSPHFRALFRVSIQSLSSLADYVCAQKGGLLLELLNPCIYKDVKGSSDKIQECENLVRSTAERYKETLPSQSDVCSVFTTFRSCIETRVEITCKNVETRQAAIQFYDAIIAPCSNHRDF